MFDAEMLKNMVMQYEISSKPMSATPSAPATVDDLNKVVNNTAQLFYAFIEQLEKS